MTIIEIKCNECGKTAQINQAKESWLWTRNRHVYCPKCVFRFNLLKNSGKGEKKQ